MLISILVLVLLVVVVVVLLLLFWPPGMQDLQQTATKSMLARRYSSSTHRQLKAMAARNLDGIILRGLHTPREAENGERCTTGSTCQRVTSLNSI